MGGPTGVSKANVSLVHRRAIWREISKFRLQPTNVAHMPNDLGLARSNRCQVDSQPCKTNVNLTSLFFSSTEIGQCERDKMIVPAES